MSDWAWTSIACMFMFTLYCLPDIIRTIKGDD
jgi:hypothetical protein